MNNKLAIIVGCGLSGAVVARELAEAGYHVSILERRNHIGGNMFDFYDKYGILVHKYGPHTFHTTNKKLFDYVCKFGEWVDYRLTCGAVINGIVTPTPFNFQTVDDFYDSENSEKIKKEFARTFPGRDFVTVLEALNCKNSIIQEYASFLFNNDYKLYTAKQWGLPPDKIDASVLKRVPLRLNYEIGYFNDKYQAIPKDSYFQFFSRLLAHKNIDIELGKNALNDIEIKGDELFFRKCKVDYPFVFTGPIDELFNHSFGPLPYRSLRFGLRHEEIDSKQPVAVLAYPQDPSLIRVIEYKKITNQHIAGTTYEEEFSLQYAPGKNLEPYYPVISEEGASRYSKYRERALRINHLYVCGRLGDFKYYNMDQALDSALRLSKKILDK